MRSGSISKSHDEFFQLEFDDSEIFKMEGSLPKRLKPKEIYTTLVGVLASEKEFYSLCSIVYLQYKEEKARVYYHLPSKRLFILYYPGKDNNDLTTPEQPLAQIMKQVDAIVKEQYGQEAYLNAKKLFIVCQSNYYYEMINFGKVEHFVKGTFDNGNIIIEDSVAWGYNLNYIKQIFSEMFHSAFQLRLTPKQNNFQNIRYDNASCGNHVIAAGRREIENTVTPSSEVINEFILNEHHKFYKLGLEKIKEAIILMPEHHGNECLLTLSANHSAYTKTSKSASHVSEEIQSFSCEEIFDDIEELMHSNNQESTPEVKELSIDTEEKKSVWRLALTAATFFYQTMPLPRISNTYTSKKSAVPKNDI